LQSCESCRQLVAESQAALAMLEQGPQEVPATLWRNLQKQVNEYEERRSASFLKRPAWHRLAVASLRTVAILAAAGIGIYLGSGIVSTQTSLADQLATDYSLVLTDAPAGSLSQSYLDIQWENGGSK
jgi:predicted anti-sigma-YlaC factor YlaD